MNTQFTARWEGAIRAAPGPRYQGTATTESLEVDLDMDLDVEARAAVRARNGTPHRSEVASRCAASHLQARQRGDTTLCRSDCSA